MASLRMVEAKLPPGFRFHPRDDELICDYLRPRASAASAGAAFHGFPVMVDVDLNNCEPWDLPETACIRGKEWYFFSVRDRKYATGQKTNRATLSGYWKATGKDRHVSRKGVLVGMRKTLVFYQGRAPKGKKTEWVMHEFRMEGHGDPPKFNSFKEDWVLCRVFYKSRRFSPKMSNESCDEDAGSSSLPPLTDSHMVNYEQAPINLEGHEQVPCFSNFAASHAAPTLLTSSERNLPDLTSCLNSISCDKKVLKVVLSHFTKLEDSQVIPESCFSETAIPSLWNPFASF